MQLLMCSMIDACFRCQESKKSEAYFPCMMAKYRVQFMDVWERYNIVLKVRVALFLQYFYRISLTLAVLVE